MGRIQVNKVKKTKLVLKRIFTSYELLSMIPLKNLPFKWYNFTTLIIIGDEYLLDHSVYVILIWFNKLIERFVVLWNLNLTNKVSKNICPFILVLFTQRQVYENRISFCNISSKAKAIYFGHTLSFSSCKIILQ